jgi:hypothetical protein
MGSAIIEATTAATAYQTTINASGTYRAVKSATAALSGVDID